MKINRFLALAIFILCLSLSACGNGADDTIDTDPVNDGWLETDAPETNPPHVHEYILSKTVAGTCLEEGYETFSCSCGLSYKNIIPSAHKYSEVKDTTGMYTKKICSLCGDYKIVRNQTYIHHLTFEGFNDVRSAVDAQKNVKFYGIGVADGTKSDGEIKESLDGKCAYISNANFYVQDVSRTMLTQKFVVSADIKFEKYTEMELISYAFQKANGDWSYNSGVIKITSDGKFKLYKDTVLDVNLKSKGYTNITVVCDPQTSLCDVYIDEQLVGSDIQYVKFPTDPKGCYIRYFYRKDGFSACIDNVKMYAADSPEFVVPDGLVFKS